MTQHNLLRTKLQELYTLSDFVDKFHEINMIREGLWRQDNGCNMILVLPPARQKNRHPWNAEGVGAKLTEYFYGLSQVSWQWNVLI